MFNLPKHIPVPTTIAPPVDTVGILRSWVSHFYIKLPEAAFTELAALIAPQLNLEDWMRRHYLTIPPDAYRALVSLLEGRTGTLVGTLESTVGDHVGTALPEVHVDGEEIHRIAYLEAEVVELNHVLDKARDRIKQLEAVVKDLTAFSPVAAAAASDIDGTTVSFDPPPAAEGPLHVSSPLEGAVDEVVDTALPPGVASLDTSKQVVDVISIDSTTESEPKPVPRVIPRTTYVPHKGPNKKR